MSHCPVAPCREDRLHFYLRGRMRRCNSTTGQCDIIFVNQLKCVYSNSFAVLAGLAETDICV